MKIRERKAKKNLSFAVELNEDAYNIFPFRLTLYSQSIWKAIFKRLTATEIKKNEHTYNGENLETIIFFFEQICKCPRR